MTSKPRSLKRIIPAFGLALVASLALTGIAAGSASAAPQAWYSCMNVGEGSGLFEDAACSKEGGTKKYAWNRLGTTSTGFVMKNVTSFTLELPVLPPLIINCSSQTGEGTIKDLSSEAGGIVSNLKLVLGGCTVSSPKTGCAVTSPLELKSFNGAATEFEGKPAVKLTPINAGGEIATFTISGCGSLNGVKTVTGSLTGIANNSTSSLEFTATSSAVYYGLKKGKFVGTSKMETSAGEALKLAP